MTCDVCRISHPPSQSLCSIIDPSLPLAHALPVFPIPIIIPKPLPPSLSCELHLIVRAGTSPHTLHTSRLIQSCVWSRRSSGITRWGSSRLATSHVTRHTSHIILFQGPHTGCISHSSSNMLESQVSVNITHHRPKPLLYTTIYR